MSYEFKDIERLRLPLSLALVFHNELIKFNRGLTPLALLHEPDSIKAVYLNIHIMTSNKQVLEDYRSSYEYLMAQDARERAKVAMNAKVIQDFDDKILTIWLKYANQMTEFEKIMAGWDKF